MNNLATTIIGSNLERSLARIQSLSDAQSMLLHELDTLNTSLKSIETASQPLQAVPLIERAQQIEQQLNSNKKSLVGIQLKVREIHQRLTAAPS